MTPEQSRAARGWLGWSQAELAKRAGVSIRTVQAFEKGTASRRGMIAVMRRAIEEGGVRLLFDQTGEPAGIARRDTTGDLYAEALPS
jgi:transcriptional regulator with XRE-family HTH domain